MESSSNTSAWWRPIGRLLSHKERIEVELFGRLRDLFHPEVELVFYDLTSTYFEGGGPVGLADFGYSREGKPRNRQVQVGLVMINGWHIAHPSSMATCGIPKRFRGCSKVLSNASVWRG
jgi:hypothetical protein